MGIHVYEQAASNTPASSVSKDLRILAAYENGGVVLHQYNRIGRETSVEGQGWNVIWRAKLHAETSVFLSFRMSRSYVLIQIRLVMAMRVSRGNTFALSVSADNLVGRYDLTV